jgi:hypothetical protein
LKKISKFNIRTTFDKLQNNNNNQKTTDLIYSLQKKIFSENNAGNELSGSIDMSKLDVGDKRNDISKVSRGSGINNFQSHGTMNFGNQNSGIGKKPMNCQTSLPKKKISTFISMETIKEISNYKEKMGMTKFFQKIKNNLDRTLSHKNGDESIQNNTNKDSSSDDDSNENSEKENGNTSSKNRMIQKETTFEQNFKMQQTMFVNKIFKFGEGNNKKTSCYDSSMYDNHQSTKKKLIQNYINFDDNIEEVEDEQNDNESFRRNSQIVSKEMSAYTRIKSQLMKNINIDDISNKVVNNQKVNDINLNLLNLYRKKIMD